MRRTLSGFLIGVITVVALGAAGDEKKKDPGAEEPLGATAAAPRARFDLEEVQGMLAVQRLDGWLLYDYAGQNPIANDVAGPSGLQTRRWFYLIPAKGQPIALVHKMESPGWANVPGQKIEYASWREMDEGLNKLLKHRKRVAMEYSPKGALPSFSRVDAGTLEMVQSHGVTVVSSAELVQAAKTRWGKAGRASHYLAAHHLDALKDDAFAWIGKEMRAGRTVTEYDVQQRIWKGYATRGLTASHPPIVAAGPNSANPHYTPEKGGSRTIAEGDIVVIDLWARIDGDPLAIYADITWVGYVGETVPKKYADVFALVAKARDDTVTFLTEKFKTHKPVQGFQADNVARGVIDKAGYGDRFIHRTGHSIDINDHGDGANLDDYETHDVRRIIQGSGFSIEPGIYQPGDFGIRSEIDCYHGADGLEVTTSVQKEIVPILAKSGK